MMRLDEREWKTFHISDLFTVKRPAARNKDDYKEGPVPFVASGSVNNGVMKCCQSFDDEKLDAAGCITVSPVDGSAFYQPYDFLGRGGAGSSILMLYRDGLNLYTSQFIAKMVSNTCSGKYDYGHMGNKDSIKREQIMLPVTDDGNPDFQFMEDYIRELMAKKKKQYGEYVKQRITELCTIADGQQVDWKSMIDSHEWEPFVVKDIADVYSGHDIYAQERIDGNTPLVTAVGMNNGIGYFVGNDNGSRADGSISVVRNGASVGKAFYHKYSALYGNDCRRLKLKETDSEFTSLFITQVIRMQNKAFSYSRKLGTGRLESLKIMLPVTADGQPDYIFMEDFGRRLMLKKYRQYLRYLENNKHYKLGS